MLILILNFSTLLLTQKLIRLTPFFVEVGSRIHNDTPFVLNNNDHPNVHMFDDVQLPEEQSLIRGIDITKDSCIEGVSSYVLKCALTTVPSKLQRLFSLSLNTGVFPRKWAHGYINILPKSGDLSNPGNWRPITQTCIPAKLKEKVVHKRLMTILTDNNILDDSQYGFRCGRSTQHAIFDLTTDSYHNMNCNLLTGLLFLDVRKAFDSLNHDILMFKLQSLGICRIMLSWFLSYLNRYQTIRFNGRSSNQLKVLSGIPQGSILGPTLFISYIKDLFNLVPNVRVKMFADDCVLLYQGSNMAIYIPTPTGRFGYLHNLGYGELSRIKCQQN